jgi:exopolyphosphatase/guanosine-5'-triphosphate,3'-diphosphate pyrophosphatase
MIGNTGMHAERHLIIDIGTNSVLALLAITRGIDIEVLGDEKATTGLGEGLVDTGNLSPAAMKRTADAVAEFTVKKGYDQAFLIGTEALRIASNAEVFSDMILRRTGEKITIILGDKEAELNFFGALHDLPGVDGTVDVIDVGGGSTEIAHGDRGRVESFQSIPLGAARLFESSTSDTLKDYAEMAKRKIMDESIGIMARGSAGIVATGGTITSLAAITAGQKKYDPGTIHGSSLSVEQIRQTALEFEGLGKKEREKQIPFDPRRADLILPGAGIFISILGIMGEDRLTVSTGGLRFGVAMRPDLLGN